MNDMERCCRLLTEVEAAKYLNVSPSTLRQQRLKNPPPSKIPRIPYLKLGRAVRYDIRVLDEVIETATVLPE